MGDVIRESNNESNIIKIMHLTDLHFNPLHRIPQSRSSRFHKQIFNKWGEVCSIIEKEKIDFGVISADLFHLKNPKIYCPEDITYYSEMFEKTGIDWAVVAGNHDEPESSFDQIDKSPYNLLCRATKNIVSLANSVVIDRETNKRVVFLNSYVYNKNENTIPINVHGYPYFPLSITMSNLETLNERAKNTPGFNIALLHMDVLIDPNIFLFWPVAGYDSVLDLLPNIDLVCLGHIHQSLPVYKRTNPKTGRVQMVSKPWSFTRVAKDYFNKTDIYEKLHKPSYSLITIEQTPNDLNVNVEYHEIPFAPFEEAFKKDVLKKQIENNAVIKNFLDEIKKEFSSVDDAFKIVNPEEYLQQKNMPDEVRNMIDRYLNLEKNE